MQTPIIFNVPARVTESLRHSAGTRTPFEVISMFSGCGGMDLGFVGGFQFLGRTYDALPFDIIWANEINETACRSYQRNIGANIRCADVWDAIETLPRRADVLIGGFPCQDISVNGKRVGLNGKRSGLYKAMVEAIRRTKPLVFVAENVKGLLTLHNSEAIKQVIRDFGELGYTISCELYKTADYGVPQNRERVFIVGTGPSLKPFVKPEANLDRSKWISAKQAIGDLEGLREDVSFNHIWSRANRSPEQGNRKLSASRPAHTIRAECHGNIQWHYDLPRRISMREAARFQSFPDWFVFDAKLRETERQVGNAVPPVMAWHVAKAVLRCLDP